MPADAAGGAIRPECRPAAARHAAGRLRSVELPVHLRDSSGLERTPHGEGAIVDPSAWQHNRVGVNLTIGAACAPAESHAPDEAPGVDHEADRKVLAGHSLV